MVSDAGSIQVTLEETTNTRITKHENLSTCAAELHAQLKRSVIVRHKRNVAFTPQPSKTQTPIDAVITLIKDTSDMEAKPIIRVEMQQRQVELVLPSNVSPERVELIANCGLRAIYQSNNPNSQTSTISNKQTSPATQSVKQDKLTVHERLVSLLGGSGGLVCNEPSMFGGVPAFQPRVLTQWQAGACGYHALYNTVLMLELADSIGATNTNRASSSMSKSSLPWSCATQPSDLVNLLSDERAFWTCAMSGLLMLGDENARERRWTDTSLSSGTLDQVHVSLLADKQYGKGDRVAVLDAMMFEGDVGEAAAIAVAKVRATGRAHGFVLGSVTHWLALVVGCVKNEVDGSVSPFMLFADSHNKDHMSVPSTPDGALKLAQKAVDDHRQRFITARQASPMYAQTPTTVLSEMYDSGVPEWWKGKPKNTLWWAHKPAQLRVIFVQKEVEASVLYMHKLGALVGAVTVKEEESECPPILWTKTSSRDDEQSSSSISNSNDANTTSPPRIDVTQSCDEFRRYVRKEEWFSPDSAQYKAGNAVENRKKPPRTQVPGDVFDRQRVIVEFDQLLIERQACLVIGTGGIGQNTALVLARLGVGRIYLLDYDDVEASNLTRQCLSGMQDVGRKKVDAAKDALETHHNLRSHITTLNGDVTLLWPSIVAIARKCTVIFNCVDVGLMFDYCVNSLSKELRIPLVSGQSFAWKMMSEVYAGDPHTVCAFCQETTERSFALEKKSLRSEYGLLGRLRAFVKAKVQAASLDDRCIQEDQQDEYEELTAESVLVSFMEQDKQFRIKGPTARDLIIKSAKQAGLTSSKVYDEEIEVYRNEGLALRRLLHISEDQIWAFLQAYHDLSLSLLSPGRISTLPDVAFIPRPIYPPTRHFGSWVGCCLGCATMMVTQWTNMLTGPTTKNPPSAIVFNLDEGMTADEQMGYEMASFGVHLDRNERTFVRDAASPDCSVCETAQRLAALDMLFYGGTPPRMTQKSEDSQMQTENEAKGTEQVASNEEEEKSNDGNRVFLVAVPGTAYAPPQWVEDASVCTKQRSERARARGGTNPLATMLHATESTSSATQKDLEGIVMPAVPALDVVSTAPATKLSEYTQGLGGPHVPWALGVLPLVKVSGKVAAALPSALVGVRSGKRSALVKVQGRWFRLKGCGNLDEGFPLESTGDKGEKSLRGSCFEHTAARELAMCGVVSRALSERGLAPCGNTSVGFYEYANRHDAPASVEIEALGLKWPLPEVTRYCSLFETSGDRRLGDHLLVGLERLLPWVIDTLSGGASLQKVVESAIVKGRTKSRGYDGGTNGDEEVVELLDTAMVCECGMDVATDLVSQALFQERDPRTVARVGVVGSAEEDGGIIEAIPAMDDLKKKEELANEAAALGTKKWLGHVDITVDESLEGVWSKACDRFAALLMKRQQTKSNQKSVMLYLAWRLGWECGQSCRALELADVSWGTYPDCNGVHCNAHANNLVVDAFDLEKEDIHEHAQVAHSYVHDDQLLRVVDLDMAFTKESFLPEIVKETAQGKWFPTEWAELVRFEQEMGMRTSLAGSDFTSTGVSNAAAETERNGSIGGLEGFEDAAVDDAHAADVEARAALRRVLRVSFRDTVVAGFDSARTGVPDLQCPVDPDMHQSAKCLVQMALVLTSQENA